MGWARTLLLGDVGNRLDISDVEQDLELLRSRLRHSSDRDESQDSQLEQLEYEHEELKLVVAALIRHLTRKGIVDEADLRLLAEG
ncbi:MAG: hypothetical protein ABFS14_02345 [Gemmatimonadota bacterium]